MHIFLMIAIPILAVVAFVDLAVLLFFGLVVPFAIHVHNENVTMNAELEHAKIQNDAVLSKAGNVIHHDQDKLE